MKVRVRSLSGSRELDDAAGLSAASTVGELLGALEVGGGPKLRLLHHGRALEVEQALGAAGVADGDTVVVLERREPAAPEAPDPTRPPDMEALNRATHAEAVARGTLAPGNPPPVGPPRGARRLRPGASVPDSVRNMESHLQSLLDAVEGLHGAVAAPSLMSNQSLSSQRGSSGSGAAAAEEEEDGEENVQLPEPDRAHMAQLVEMGFAEEAVKKALLLTNNRLELAMDWLLEHGSDPDATQPLSEAELRELGRRHRRRQRVNLAAFRPAAAAPSQGPASTTAFDAPPPAALVETLVEMGFESGAARGALAAFRNNVEMACHWLLTAGSRPGAVPPAPPTQRQPSSGPAPDDSPRGVVHPGASTGAAEVPPRPRSPSQLETPYGNPGSETRSDTLSSSLDDHDGLPAEPLDEQLSNMQSFLESLGVDALMLGELLQNPVIRSALQRDRVMQAFQDMIQDPSSAHRYLADPEVGPALLQVHRLLGNDGSGTATNRGE